MTLSLRELGGRLGFAGCLILLGFSYGYIAYHFKLPPDSLLRGFYATLAALFAEDTKENTAASDAFLEKGAPARAYDEKIRKLRTLGYAGGVKAGNSGVSGVTVFKPTLAHIGLNLVTIGHRPEARLMTMTGDILHTWSLPFLESFPGESDRVDSPGAQKWRRVHLLENGELFAVHEGVGLLKINSSSELLWSRANGAHHDLEVAPDGRIYCLSREAEMVPWFNPRRPILVDYILILDSNGYEIERLSIMEAIRDSAFASLLKQGPTFPEDPLHTNELELLQGRLADQIPSFRKGNVLLSVNHLSSVMVVDLAAKQVVWAHTGLTWKQHSSTILSSGNMLLFDNLGNDGRSRVLEMNPITQMIMWSYDNSHGSLWSPTCGAVQRLPNGNTLITETDAGRALEVTADREIVWEFYSPERTGQNEEFIARLLEVTRLRKNFRWTK